MVINLKLRHGCLSIVFFIFALPLLCPALTLQEGLKIISENGRDIQVSRQQEQTARENVSLARSRYFPTVDAFANETQLRYQPQAIFGPATVPLSQRAYPTYGFNFNQLVYDFGRTSSLVKASREALRTMEIDTSRVSNASALDFTLAYLDLLEAEKRLKVAEDEVKRYEAHLRDTNALFEQGMITRNSVLQAQVFISDSQQRLLSAGNLKSIRASRINSLLLLSLDESVIATEVEVKPSAGIALKEAWESAEQNRPELKEMESRIMAREAELRSIQSEFMPTLFLSGGYQYEQNRYMVNQDNWSIVGGITVNLSAGGATRARMRAAASEIRTLQLEREKTRDDIRLDVKRAFLDLDSAEKRLEVTKTATAQAEENLRLQRLRYQEGEATATDVLDAVSLLTTAETNYWSAVYGIKRAEAGLLYSMGKELVKAYGE